MGVLNGVIGEVFHRRGAAFPSRPWISARSASAFAGKRNIFIGGYWDTERLFNKSKQIDEVYRLDVRNSLRLASAFEMVRMLFTKLRSSVRICLDIGNGIRAFSSSRFGFVEQQTREGENRSERRAQFMTYDGEKLAFIGRFLTAVYQVHFFSLMLSGT